MLIGIVMCMNLHEYEGKELLRRGGIEIPRGKLFDGSDAPPELAYPVFVKAQILAGRRMSSGGIMIARDYEELALATTKLLGSTLADRIVKDVLVEEAVAFTGQEHFVSFSCDTKTRTFVCTTSDEGGTGIEERPVQRFVIDYENPQFDNSAVPRAVLEKLFDIFCVNDCILLEVNPLVHCLDTDTWVALDAKIVIDDFALPRHPEFTFSERTNTPGNIRTSREIAAQKIDHGDHRGSAGSSYVDLDGNIGMLPSGGGASLIAMDALFQNGGRPANYTEYSGNPTKEKVEKLVSIVISKPGLHALWVVGAVANFTDIYETLSGLVLGLRAARNNLSLPIDYPIIIRRGGPRDEEAYAMLREVTDFDLHLFGEETSIEQSAKEVMKLAQAYANKQTHTK